MNTKELSPTALAALAVLADGKPRDAGAIAEALGDARRAGTVARSLTPLAPRYVRVARYITTQRGGARLVYTATLSGRRIGNGVTTP